MKRIIFFIIVSFLLVIAIFISMAKPVNWLTEIGDAEKTAKTLKSLLHADRVYIYSRMLSGDIDNDARDELIISAIIVNHNERNFPVTDKELILLSKEKILFWNKYRIKAKEKLRAKSSILYLDLKDLTGNGRFEIIICDSKNPFYLADNQIYRLEKGRLLPVLFKGGEFDGTEIVTGKFEFKAAGQGYDVIVRYGPGLGVADSYRWDGRNYIAYSEATKGLGAEEQRIISYLKKHITGYIRERDPESLWFIHEIQFYPPDKVLVYAETGHISLYVLFEYALHGNVIMLRNLYQHARYRPDYLEGKYNLLPDDAVNYFPAQEGYKWTPSNVFE